VVVGRDARLVHLYRYRLAGELTEIGADDLALTVEETAEIVAAHGARLSAKEVEALHAGTEGWTTGVCLHALALPTGDATGFPRPAGHQAVAEFLHSELVEAQPPRVQDMLLRTSILDEVHADLADRLTGRYDARGLLDQLVRSNSFVQALDDSRFRYRAPLRDVLHDELTTRHPDLVRRLHSQAAHWYTDRHRYGDAITHAVTIGAWDYAADVAVNRLGVGWLLTAPQAANCRSTLAELPADEDAPAAHIIRPLVALADLDIAAARIAVDRADAALRRHAGRADHLRLSLAVLRVVLARYTGDAETARRTTAELDRVWGRFSPALITGEPVLRALVLSNLGVAQFWAGQLTEARTALSRAACATDPGTEYIVHDAQAHLAMIQLYEGKLHQADKYARESLAVADRAGIRPAARVGAASAALAGTALIWNDLPALREHMSRAVVAASTRIDPPTAIAVALLRARAAQGRHDGRRALAAIDAARVSLAGWRPSPVVAEMVELAAANAHLTLGEIGAARTCLDTVSEGPERTLAVAQLLIADGETEAGRRLLAGLTPGNTRPATMQEVALALGRLAFVSGDLPAAVRALRDALEYGRPDRRRRTVAEAGEWVRQLLRQQPDLAAEHDWLRPPGETGDNGSGVVPVHEPLTERETEVLGRLAEALSTEDIADALYLSVNTVKTHLKSIYRKLGTSGRSATARLARELKILP
jgi:LuxR family maltose regulon positive regulatory protein